ncbi:ANTAR domain-containing protein [Streptomyces sp. NBC_01304]|uniref:ANTAR domain-containing protein n=1 Tax=Streptomyces sp. NBC_01304 TaxID=2903818 RepID=UPI002E12752C|nr:ANTAR domain-containing protein [Streptomyces sp. NBC_01304]
MNQTVRVKEERWALKAEVAWGDAALAPAIAMLRVENDTLRRALAGHVVIDQARGMVMALAPCSRGEARSLLVDVSRQCDLRLREVAAAFVATSDGVELPRELHVALRRALRRLHAAQRR